MWTPGREAPGPPGQAAGLPRGADGDGAEGDASLKVLVIGRTRFLGHELAWRLVAGGHAVTLFDRGTLPDTLARHSVANLDNVHVVACADLVSRIGALPRSREGEVNRALGYALDWPELKFGNDEDAAQLSSGGAGSARASRRTDRGATGQDRPDESFH